MPACGEVFAEILDGLLGLVKEILVGLVHTRLFHQRRPESLLTLLQFGQLITNKTRTMWNSKPFHIRWAKIQVDSAVFLNYLL